MSVRFSQNESGAIPIDVVDAEGLEDYLAGAGAPTKSWLLANEFKGKLGQTVLIPNEAGQADRVVTGWG